jgi:hypothetical protein
VARSFRLDSSIPPLKDPRQAFTLSIHECSWKLSLRNWTSREALYSRARAASLVREWTGRHSRDVGSFGLRLNLESSDLDLGIGYPVAQWDALSAALVGHSPFKGERVTRFPAA